MKSFLTGTKTPISIFWVSVKPSESVGIAVVVPFGSKVVLPYVVKTRYSQTARTFKGSEMKLNGLWTPGRSQCCRITSMIGQSCCFAEPEINIIITFKTCLKTPTVWNTKINIKLTRIDWQDYLDYQSLLFWLSINYTVGTPQNNIT